MRNSLTIRHRPQTLHGLRSAKAINCILVLLFIGEGILAKSQIDNLIGGWRGHMIGTVLLIGALIFARLAHMRHQLSHPLSFPTWPKYLLVTAFGWALFCCLDQPNALGNVAYVLVFAAHIYVCLYAVPHLLVPFFGERALLVCALPLGGVVLANLAFAIVGYPHAFYNGRLAGFMCNPLHAGYMARLSSLLFLWAVLRCPSKRRILMACWFLSLVMLLMTRTRSSIFGCLFGSVVMLGHSQKVPYNPLPRRHIFAFGVLFFLASAIVVLSYETSVGRLADYFRFKGSVSEVFEGRMRHWSDGIEYAREKAVFGGGPLAKFGDTHDPTVNTYDTEWCFTNTWLTMTQAYGVPGGVLYALFYLSILLGAAQRKNAMSNLTVGVVAMGIGSSFSHMWATSFGSPGDRITWMLLGIALATDSLAGAYGETHQVRPRAVSSGRQNAAVCGPLMV